MDPLADPTPLYFRIQRALRNDIVSGRLPPGTLLPTEQQLRETYGVSRITVTKALDALRAGGLIVSRRGVGSFVADAPPTKSLRLIGSLDEALAPAPDLLRSILSMEQVDTPSDLPTPLALQAHDRVLRVISGYATDAGPYSYAHAFVPPAFAELIDAASLSGGRAIIHLIQQRTGLRVIRADQVVDPVNADNSVAEALGIRRGDALLRVSRSYIAEGERCVLSVRSWFHPTRYRYAVQLLPAVS